MVESASTSFAGNSGCAQVENRVRLAPGEMGYTQTVSFAYDQSGHALHTTLIACATLDHDQIVCPVQAFDVIP